MIAAVSKESCTDHEGNVNDQRLAGVEPEVVYSRWVEALPRRRAHCGYTHAARPVGRQQLRLGA